jgi:hypothetical protein
MLKTITTIILLGAFAAQTFNRSVIVLDYYSNKAAFAKKCENKARPQLLCKGKCQMLKKLKQEEKKDEQNPERRLENKSEVFSSKSYFATYNADISGAFASFVPLFSIGHPKDCANTFFHPPASV